MDTSRRRFLGLGAAATTAYFFAPVGGWYSDVILNPNRIAPKQQIDKSGKTAYQGKYSTLWIDENEPDPWRRMTVEVHRRTNIFRGRSMGTIPAHLMERRIILINRI